MNLAVQYNMTDIVNINIGQAGVRIGHHFCQTLRQQHRLDHPSPAGNLAFFEQKSRGYESRSIFIDLNKREIDKLAAHQDSLYNPHDLIASTATSRGLYAESAYTVFPELSEEILDRVRRRVEACDSLSGFLVISSMGGGTSSGLGNRISQEVRNHYPDKAMQSFKLLPDLASAHPLEIYNCAHSVYKEVENSDLSLLFDNGWAERGAGREGGRGMGAVNAWVARNIAESTIPFRFSGQLNTSQRKIATNLVLFPRIHFLPFANAPSLAHALRPDALSLSNYYAQGGKVFNVYAGVHDTPCSEQEANSTIVAEFQRHQLKFVQWLENVHHLSLHDPVSAPSSTFIVNSFNMKQYFSAISQRFTLTYRRRGFECWYRTVGLDSMEFTQIQSNVNDLTSEYTPFDNYEVDEYSEMSEEPE